MPKLIIVSNRLPISFSKNHDGWSFKKSSGGLVTGLKGIEHPFIWVGWLGDEIQIADQPEVLETLKLQHPDLRPVFLSKIEEKDYYSGFSNSILWPLFQYQCEKSGKHYNDLDELYKSYCQVNEKFSKVVLENYEEGDLVWVHDYQLFLVPKILRSHEQNMKIGFFLHIPFPSSEIYRILPVSKEILEGILSSNLIGFHTHDYVRHFLNSCTQIFGTSTSLSGFLHEKSFVSINAYPIGISPNQFQSVMKEEKTIDKILKFKEQFKNRKIILGIDRLDYTKGIDLKLNIYRKFLDSYQERPILIQIGVPTRENIDAYSSLKDEVNRLVGEINSVYGSLDYNPILYLNQSVDMNTLCALYSIADICFITSIRDGMNLVALEYIICQDEAIKYREDHGVLLLSEFAGASRSLNGSIIINPYDQCLCSKKILSTLYMDKEEKSIRHQHNFDIVVNNTAQDWCTKFIHDLEKSSNQDYFPVSTLPILNYSILQKSLFDSQKRLFILDYDGTLVNLNRDPLLALPSQRLKKILNRLLKNPKNNVIILSGRSKDNLTEIFKDVPEIGLSSEHGFIHKDTRSNEWNSLYEFKVENTWKDMTLEILESFCKRTFGAFIEENPNSIVFNYRNCEESFGDFQANELKLYMKQTFTVVPMDIIDGKKIIEFRPMGVSKGYSTHKLISKYTPDFILCAGDDKTDEESFEQVNKEKNGISCVIGNESHVSKARYHTKNVKSFLSLLELISFSD